MKQELCELVNVFLPLLCVSRYMSGCSAPVTQPRQGPSGPVARVSGGGGGGQSTVLTENGSHIEGCAIRLHCASLVSLIEYRSSFSCAEGAITKSLQAIGEI